MNSQDQLGQQPPAPQTVAPNQPPMNFRPPVQPIISGANHNQAQYPVPIQKYNESKDAIESNVSVQSSATENIQSKPADQIPQDVQSQQQQQQQFQTQLIQSDMANLQANQPQPPQIKPLLIDADINSVPMTQTPTTSLKTDPQSQQQQQQQQPSTPLKTVVTKVKLSDELNIFDWLRTTDLINQIAEKAKSSVDTVITALDPGMKEYLYSGGNINIMVISEYDSLVSPIRDSFQTVFGRATVSAARYNPPDSAFCYPIKLSRGFHEAVNVAKDKIKKLRLDTNNVPQNQVIVAIQPTLVSLTTSNESIKEEENILPKWFLTYCMIIEDPVLNVTMSTYSQFIPMEPNIIEKAQETKLPDGTMNWGFAKSIDEIMTAEMKLPEVNKTEHEYESSQWLKNWAGLDEIEMIHELSLTLANSYRRKWNDYIS